MKILSKRETRKFLKLLKKQQTQVIDMYVVNSFESNVAFYESSPKGLVLSIPLYLFESMQRPAKLSLTLKKEW